MKTSAATVHHPLHAAELRVLVIDRHPLARSSIRHLALAEGDVASVEEAEDIAAWMSVRGPHDPEVVVLGESDPRLIRDTVAAAPRARIVVLGLDDDPIYVERALAAGAAAYVVRERADRELAPTLRAVAGGMSTNGHGRAPGST